MAKAAKPLKYCGRWRGQVTLDNGTRPAKSFDKYDDAVQWMAEQRANANTEHLPELGGPKQASLAQALAHYAGLNTITKGGYAAELDRVNHYLMADGIKPLKIVVTGGKRELVEKPTKNLPSAFAAHKDSRLAQREETYKQIANLAQRKCSTLCTADFRRLMVTMEKDGLSGSTIQKEIALLKHLFNVAAKEWNWKGFENPCNGLKLSGSEMRFVFITAEQQLALREALAQCDNPYFWPLVEICLETTLRVGSLLAMSRSNVDLDGRIAMLPSKTGQVSTPLSLKAVELLKGMPVHESGKYFPMSANAVDMAWDGVRQKIGMPQLQFRDLRHIGATGFARVGANPHQLQRLLGHKSTRQAEVYVNLCNIDTLEFLDRVAPKQAVFQIPEPASGSGEEMLNRKRSKRLTDAIVGAAKAVGSKKVLDTGDSTQNDCTTTKALASKDATEQFLETCNDDTADEVALDKHQTNSNSPRCADNAVLPALRATGTHGMAALPSPVSANVIQVDFKRRR